MPSELWQHPEIMIKVLKENRDSNLGGLSGEATPNSSAMAAMFYQSNYILASGNYYAPHEKCPAVLLSGAETTMLPSHVLVLT